MKTPTYNYVIFSRLFGSTFTPAAEHGTLYQLRDLVHRTNVVSDPVKDFNACDNFIILVVTCHILTASLLRF